LAQGVGLAIAAYVVCRSSICLSDHVFHPFADIPHGSRSPAGFTTPTGSRSHKSAGHGGTIGPQLEIVLSQSRSGVAGFYIG